jgi:hypothetical protein
MGVRRAKLDFEGRFVQIPNEWLRDERLSRRARGLLAEIMTHRVGWHITIGSLQKAGTEGRDAIRSALNELKDAGYLRLLQSRGDKGRWNEVEYELTDPTTGDGFPDSGGFTDSGSTDSGESDTKNTIQQEHHLEDKDIRSIDDEFSEWWSLYPRKQAKLDALKAFKTARKTVDLETLLTGLRAYLLLNAGREKQFLKLPAGWLRDGRWLDDAIPTGVKSSVPVPPRKGEERECPVHAGYPIGNPSVHWSLQECRRCTQERIESMGSEF